MKSNLLSALFIFFLMLLVFHSWFTSSLNTGGDINFYYNQILGQAVRNIFTAWGGQWGNGVGAFGGPFLWVNMLYGIPIFILGTIFHLSWVWISKIGFFYLFIVLAVISITTFYNNIFGKRLSLISIVIFLFNTYILMLLGGGQVSIFLSYAFAPITLTIFIKTINYLFIEEKRNISKYLRYGVIAGIVLAVEVLLDPRMVYVTMVGLVVYFILKIINQLRIANYGLQAVRLLYSLFFVFVIPGVVAVLLHAFWLLPTLMHHTSPLAQLGTAYDSAGAVKFFSFATFENTLSLLHPNWPENIFGKIYFMRPEFLLLPILAFSSLFFINGKRKTENDEILKQVQNDKKRLPREENSLAMRDENLYVIFFALLGLLGAFLAKGANDPFGGIYLWLFGHVPGFVMFRDPTKWYLLIAISYSMLIPYTVSQIYDRLSKRTENKKQITEDREQKTNNKEQETEQYG